MHNPIIQRNKKINIVLALLLLFLRLLLPHVPPLLYSCARYPVHGSPLCPLSVVHTRWSHVFTCELSMRHMRCYRSAVGSITNTIIIIKLYTNYVIFSHGQTYILVMLKLLKLSFSNFVKSAMMNIKICVYSKI